MSNENEKEVVEEVKEENENYLDEFVSDDEELVDLTTEKIDELNKKLPTWSIEPPEKFLSKK
ncbi:MAG: hypothetical protein K5762_07385 [Bacilli bacterium]|nr:hypothetical protein [Bacilli bacterium]